MPSSLPTNPKWSVVVTLIPTRSTVVDRAVLTRCRMAAIKCPSLGFCANIVASTLDMRQPASPTNPATVESSNRLEMSLYCGSLEGKWVPLSPRPAAPRRASMMA